MAVKIGVFGCCVSRDAFNSKFISNYKNFFEIPLTLSHVSMISLMQKPMNVNDNLISIYPLNQSNNYATQVIKRDLNKSFLKELLEFEIDYLIIDNYLEIVFGIYYINDYIVSFNHYLDQTLLFQNSNNFKRFRMQNNAKKYFKLWSHSCNLFFKYLNDNCPNIKVVLNKARPIDKFLNKKDGSIYINKEYTLGMNTVTPLMDKLDSYIEDNFEVRVIEFDKDNFLLDETHLWGIGPVHFTKDYYWYYLDCLKKIVISDLYEENTKLKLKLKQYNNFTYPKLRKKTLP